MGKRLLNPGMALALAVLGFFLCCCAWRYAWLGRFFLARTYAAAQRYDDAVREYSVSLQIMTEYVKNAGPLKAESMPMRLLKAAYFERGQALSAKGNSDGAARDYRSSLAVRAESRTFDVLALNMVRTGNSQQAEKYFKLAVVHDARDVEALNDLGEVFLRKKDFEMARFWFERALKVRPGFGPAWDNLKKLDIKR